MKKITIESMRIDIDGKKYKLVDNGEGECEECAFHRDDVLCPTINGKLFCTLFNATSIWKEVK